MMGDHLKARVDQLRSQGTSYQEIKRILNQEQLAHETREAETVEDLKKVILTLIRRANMS
jgi:DNA-binding transcriptional MerR regulator